ncbi:MAG: hypothetical protein EA355_07955 [Rhodobacteraceae bacterium]|nr:MAG: hypothetical protein EA355_07955 [Paracoccaceae bacterium]
MRRLAPFVVAVLTAASAAAQGFQGRLYTDYPTEALADYVFACMAANGNTREALERCSCSIDHISVILPYERYIAAETVLRMRQLAGERSSVFRTAAEAKDAVAELRRAQAEADVVCF